MERNKIGVMGNGRCLLDNVMDCDIWNRIWRI